MDKCVLLIISIILLFILMIVFPLYNIIRIKYFKKNIKSFGKVKGSLIKIDKAWTKAGRVYRGVYKYSIKNNKDRLLYDKFVHDEKEVYSSINIYYDKKTLKNVFTLKYLESLNNHYFIIIVGTISFVILAYVFYWIFY